MHRITATLSLAATLAAANTLAAQGYPEERVVRIDARPDSVHVRVGERVPVRFVPLDSTGAAVDDVVMRVSMRGAGAWFDSTSSEVLGLAPGEEVLRARVRRARRDGPGFNDIFAAIEVRVLPGAADRLVLQPPSAPVLSGSSVTLVASAYSGEYAISEPDIRWSSADPTVLKVTPGGFGRALRPGQARVTATSEEVSESLVIRVVGNPVRELSITPAETVTRVGDVVELTAVALNGAGGRVENATVDWTVLAGPSTGRDDAYLDAEGAFVAYQPGVFRVLALVGGISAVAEIHAIPRTRRSEVRLIAHGVVPTGQSTTDLWVFEGRDGRDYVYTGTYSGNLLYVWDVTEAANPIITDSLEFDGRRVNDVKINADESLAVVTSENASNRRNGITVLDISVPAHPQRLTHFTENLTGGVHNTWIAGDLVYAVHYGTMDLHIIDIANPGNPRQVGRWGLPHDNKWLHDVTIADGLAYLSYWDDGLVVLDIGAGIAGGTPTQPALVSQHKYKYQLSNDGEWYGNTHHAVRYGKYVFVGDEIFGCAECVNGPRGYIHVLDVTDIANPREVANYRVPEAGVHNMWAEDDKLYIGYYQAGLRVLDISGELRGDLYRQGREIGWYMTEDSRGTDPNATFTWGAQPYKGKIFASDGSSGLWIFELIERGPTLVP